MLTPTPRTGTIFAKRYRRSPILRTIVSGLLIVLLTSQSLAQQTASIKDLELQIKRMEEVQRDPAVPESVKQHNANFLQARRSQLQTLLSNQLEGLSKYKSDFGASLSATEKETLDKSIEALSAKLEDLKKRFGTNGPAASMTAESSAETNGNGNGNGAPSAESASSLNTAAATPASAANTSTGPTGANLLPQTITVAPDCYSDAPPVLVKTASAAATLVVEEGADETSTFLQRLIFYTIADAVSRGEKERELIRSLGVRQVMEETRRMDKQTGASATSEGSTSALEKPNFANLLAFAIEHGAIDKQVSGTTLTLSSSPYAFIAAAQGDTSTTYKNYEFFHRIGISANFNIKDENDVLASARRNQLSEWSVRARLSKDRSTRSAEFEQFWNRDVRGIFERLPLVLVEEFSALFRVETDTVRRQVGDRFIGYSTQFLAANSAQSKQAQQAGLQQLLICKLKEDVFDKIDSFGLTEADRQRIVARTLPALRDAIVAEEGARKLVDDQIAKMNNRPLATFAYTNKRDPLTSDYSVFKFLYDRKTFSPMKFMANAGLSVYHRPNPLLNQQRIRDFAAAVSLEGNAGRSPFLTDDLDQSQITFAFTGRYERMFENRNTINRKADIGIFQFRLEVPFISGMSFPFSVTYANATELIKEDHVRANFGFSFDADKLFFLKTFLRR